MKTLELNNGLVMPALGLGTWKSKPGEVANAVKVAVRAGYRHLDCAWIYGNEKEIGEALAELFEEGVVTRDELWVTSKLWNDRHAPKDVEPALRDTLSKLGLEYLDLYLMHWPIAHRLGKTMPKTADDMVSLDELPLESTWAAMEKLVDAGLTRSIGVSNFNSKKLRALLKDARIRPAANQVELHPYLQQYELKALCDAEGVILTAYSPLGSKDRPPSLKAEDEPILLEDPVIGEIAAAKGASTAQVLIAWALHRGTSVIPKSTNEGRIKQNLEAATLELNADEMSKIETLDRARRYVDGRFWAVEGSTYTMESLWEG